MFKPVKVVHQFVEQIFVVPMKCSTRFYTIRKLRSIILFMLYIYQKIDNVIATSKKLLKNCINVLCLCSSKQDTYLQTLKAKEKSPGIDLAQRKISQLVGIPDKRQQPFQKISLSPRKDQMLL